MTTKMPPFIEITCDGETYWINLDHVVAISTAEAKADDTDDTQTVVEFHFASKPNIHGHESKTRSVISHSSFNELRSKLKGE